MARILSYASDLKSSFSKLSEDINILDQTNRFASSFNEHTKEAFNNPYGFLTNSYSQIKDGVVVTVKSSLSSFLEDIRVPREDSHVAYSSFEKTEKAVDSFPVHPTCSDDLVKELVTSKTLQDVQDIQQEGLNGVLQDVQYVIQRALNQIFNYAQQHPYELAAILALVIGGSVPAIVTTPLFTAIGMSPHGPIAGTLISAWQATYGGYVPAGSLFAAFQSIAMTGHSRHISALAWTAVAAIGAYQCLNVDGLTPTANLALIEWIGDKSDVKGLHKVDNLGNASPNIGSEGEPDIIPWSEEGGIAHGTG